MNAARDTGTAQTEAPDLALLQRWFEALRAAEPSAVAAIAFADDPTGALALVAELGAAGEPDVAVLATARGARERGKLQLAPLKATGRTVLATPLTWPTRPGAVVAVLLDRPLAEASRFAPAFQVSVARLTHALQQAPKPEKPRPLSSPDAPPGFGAVDALALLQARDADAFAEGLYARLEAALKPDTACLVQVLGARIKLLRNSSKFDPLPRGGRVGHSRRVALLSVANAGRTLQTSWSEAGAEPRVNLDLGLLAAGEGPARAVAVSLPQLHGSGRLVFLGEYLDRDRAPAIDANLEAALDELGATIGSLRGKRGRKGPQSGLTRALLGKWLWRGAFAVAAIGAAIWLAMPAPLVITGEATLASTDMRSIVATRDGILAKVHFEPGQQVKRGEVIAEFDTRELRLRDNRIAAQLAQAESRKQSAVAGFKAAEIRVVDAEIDALSAERDLVGLLLEQSVVTAEGDAIILSGDMAERVGSALRKGEQMFQLAPLSGYTVSIDVPQQDVTSVAVGQHGALKLTAMPFDEYPVEIERVSPAASDASATGAFTIRAALDAANPSFRPGMKGVVHITAGETVRAWGLTRDFWFWLRMQAWRWIP